MEFGKIDLIDVATGAVLPSVLKTDQAYSAYTSFVHDNKERNDKNARIAKKLNGEQPWDAGKLKSAGQSWRSNRPTGFMASLIKRISPPYKQVIDQLPLLTYARFEEESLGSPADQDVFRKEVTDTIRHWSGWSDFLQRLIDEDICYGYAASGYKDEFSWKPVLYRSDEAFFYVGCPQTAEDVKIWGLKEDFFVDEAAAILKDPIIAASAGWSVENLAKKLNTARDQYPDTEGGENSRLYEDLIRENNLAASFTSTVKVIKAGHIFAVNPAGGVDHYIFDREDGTALFFRRARYSSMEKCLSLFSAEVGNGTLHSSRGAGRALYNTHISVEQARNLVNDALHLSGLLLLQRTQKSGVGDTENPGLTVNHPFAIIGDGYTVLEQASFEINAKAFFDLDKHATTQAELLVGAFLPGQLGSEEGTPRTASEVNYVASIDSQIRTGILSRFADQIFNLIDQIQRRICHPRVVQVASGIFESLQGSGKTPIFDLDLRDTLQDSGVSENFAFMEIPHYLEVDSVKCVLRMLEKGLTTTQIVLLSNSSSKANVDDAIASQSGALDIVVSKYVGDPMVDTVELKRRDISSKLGSSAAQRLMNVDLSPMSKIKQQRQQLMELTSLLEGEPIPVDPTDDDVTHLETIISRISPLIEGAQQLAYNGNKTFLEGVLAHAEAHLQGALNKGTKPKDLSEIQGIIEDAKSLLQKETLEGQAGAVVAPALGQGVMVAPSQTGSLPEDEEDPSLLGEGNPAALNVSPQDVIEDTASPSTEGIASPRNAQIFAQNKI